MDFAFNDEQLMIQDSAASFLAKASDSAAVRAAMLSPNGFAEPLWQQLAQELYWPALIIPEQYGGMGLGFVEQAILLEQMGKHLLCAPFLSSACIATSALLLAQNEAVREQWLPELAAGNLLATLAYQSARGDWRRAKQPVAQTRHSGWVLNGQYDAVLDGARADVLLLTATLEDGQLAIFAVPSNTQGVERRALATMDQTRRMARITLDNVVVNAEQRLLTDTCASELLTQTLQLGAIALACEQVGGAQQSLNITLSYIGERKQFNRTIASFQAIKHRCADMMLAIENARSAVYYAACIAEQALAVDGDIALAGELEEASCIAKSEASETFMHCAAESIQLHGGVGFTWEYDPHLYFKRARASEQLLGSPSWHRECLANLILESRP